MLESVNIKTNAWDSKIVGKLHLICFDHSYRFQKSVLNG